MTEVRVVTDEREREDAFAVREDVFVDEQGVDEELEYDEHDEPEADAVHFVAYDGDDPVGAARLRFPEQGIGKVERVAVLASHRGDDLGRDLMDAVHAAARDHGVETLKLHAQTRAAGFYERLGYEARGEEFEEAGIPHVEMRRSLSGGT
ncbi:Predicted N-acyltransferase, GNAT family [Natronoarchaeum philippinense]|uniref:Predicted N-acyltransferase, GNAT family n=1 Tax=Natronoarchaeum philippinense TaxID=558529 RepID=A0A285NAW6_NATPI|nr:GNAT family N-acetyltransferase [Natronoarchaeum philippinense]SNZ06634.1 Predicted N-acyltransferase, GNAT family [Natronoarchaeum philippinense]